MKLKARDLILFLLHMAPVRLKVTSTRGRGLGSRSESGTLLCLPAPFVFDADKHLRTADTYAKPFQISLQDPTSFRHSRKSRILLCWGVWKSV